MLDFLLGALDEEIDYWLVFFNGGWLTCLAAYPLMVQPLYWFSYEAASLAETLILSLGIPFFIAGMYQLYLTAKG